MMIVWLSRHPALPAQVRELRRLFGRDVEIRHDSRPFDRHDGAGDIMSRPHVESADEVVLVAPLSVMDALCRRGLHPLRAEMDAVPAVGPLDSDREVDVHGRRYRFNRFVRVVRMELVTEELGG